jgi:2-amino-4-hydroxy-6-hydroxymethyldihydropteridine diphosphokinase
VLDQISTHRRIYKKQSAFSADHILQKVSTIRETLPIGYTDQANFLNCSVLLETQNFMEQFKYYLKDVENRLGRIRTANKNGPRTIDLDIIIWNGEIVDANYYERDFLKKSIKEIFPHLKC